MNYIKKSVITGTILSQLLLTSLCASAKLKHEQIDALVEKAQVELNVPGIALAIVKGDEVIHAKGYGVQSIDSNTPTSTDTLFQVGSISKSFRTAALSLLVDQNKIGWDDKVIDYLPHFRMYDPWVTQEFTIRDLLSHRSGLPLGAGDLLQWPDARATPDEIIKALRYLKPESSFRSEYAYDNLMYIVAEEIIRVVTRMPWHKYVEKALISPLQMTGCVASPSRISEPSKRATAHMEVNGELKTTFFKDDDLVNCDILGMAKWAQLFLAKGKLPNGQVLISEQQLQEMWKPVTLQKVPYMAKKYSQTHFQAYGLGWRLKDFHGHLHVSHGGAVQGMTSHIAFLPEKDLAVIALTNQWSRAAQGLTATILESYIEEQPTNYIDLYIEGNARYKAYKKQQKNDSEPTSVNAAIPPLDINQYAGTYHDDWYGKVYVKVSGPKLKIKFSRSEALSGSLTHLEGNRFVAKWTDRTLNADAYVNFEVDFKGSITGLKMKAVSRSTDFSYNFHDLNLKKKL
ncbi:serine hydrolase [Pseudoalteromonas sp. Of7M-16]|uniref:serine hydrolase n=1 Tax=Pseudoalteromonas sp. Of7M-16 TaxID=2917756 RepID=UPI001EF44149|nr:serine hydrolase [Pseudoalteromonas sp. Of7M-16]MCG7551200.1 serine hydrolase [Pseudoalteromonas sp. Of7M-16]